MFVYPSDLLIGFARDFCFVFVLSASPPIEYARPPRAIIGIMVSMYIYMYK
jgi:hypothetical protein